MEHTLKVTGGCLLATLVCSTNLYQEATNNLDEFLERNPECLKADSDSLEGLLRSSFKKTETFRIVLLAIAGSFFVHRLCFELGRIIIQAQEDQREKDQKVALTEPQTETVIEQLQKPEKTKEEKKKEAKAKASKEKRLQEAFDLVATCLESFAYYYYVQRRALVNQEIKMFETPFCTKFEHDWEATSLQWLYLRLGVTIHDVYKNLRYIHAHQNRIKLDPDSSTNFAATIAHGGSLLASLLTLAFIAISLTRLDAILLAPVTRWIVNLDILRLASGLTCVVRILIVHAEVHTLLLAAGFFTYMYLYSLYQSWMATLTIFEDDAESKMPNTLKLFSAQKAAFFTVAAVSLISYFVHTYRQAIWKMLPDNKTIVTSSSVDKSKTTAENKKEEPLTKEKSKKNGSSKKGSKKNH